MITAVICSIVLGFLVGTVFIGLCCGDPFPIDLTDFERQRRIRAEHDAIDLYRQIENMRRDQVYLSSYTPYQAFDYGWTKKPFEIQKIPRAMSQDDAKEKYGEHYLVTDGIIGKMNEIISEVNHLSTTPLK